jgi:hypothetical protein
MQSVRVEKRSEEEEEEEEEQFSGCPTIDPSTFHSA